MIDVVGDGIHEGSRQLRIDGPQGIHLGSIARIGGTCIDLLQDQPLIGMFEEEVVPEPAFTSALESRTVGTKTDALILPGHVIVPFGIDTSPDQRRIVRLLIGGLDGKLG